MIIMVLVIIGSIGYPVLTEIEAWFFYKLRYRGLRKFRFSLFCKLAVFLQRSLRSWGRSYCIYRKMVGCTCELIVCITLCQPCFTVFHRVMRASDQQHE